jgi:hypothetical protein
MSLADKLTPQQQREAIEAWFDHEQFCANALSIRDKSGRVVPLVLTPAQKKLNEVIRQQEMKGIPVRIRVLKSRQVHMSVGAASQVFRRVAFVSGQRAKVYAHLDEASAKIFEYYDQFDTTYRPLKGIRKLTRKRRVQGEEIEYDGGGLIEFGSAETGRGGRGGSFKYLHLSETAFWRRGGADLRTGLLNSVPPLEDTLIIDESTANGEGNDFHEAWLKCVDPLNKSGWIGMFYGWHEHPEYVLKVEDPESFQRSLTDPEWQVMQQHSLRLEQIAWRRWQIETECEGDPRRFQQEYPATPEEAFLTSGRPRFCMVTLSRQPLIRDAQGGELNQVQVGTRMQIQWQPSKDGSGALRIFRRPAEGHLYIIGADSAEGKDVKEGRGTADPDYAVAQVLDRDTGEQVAILRERLTPAVFGEYVVQLARLYNNAYLVPELNNTGIAVIQEIMRHQWPLELIYRDPRSQDPGYRTGEITKPQMISALDRAIREGQITLHDPVTVRECRSFAWQPNGKMSAPSGGHDDCVIGLALAVVGLPFAPARKRVDTATPQPVSYRKYGRRG